MCRGSVSQHTAYCKCTSHNRAVLVSFPFIPSVLQDGEMYTYDLGHLPDVIYTEISMVSVQRGLFNGDILSLSTATPVLSCEAATQTERRLDLATVTLRRGARPRAPRCRPRSLIDYRSYIDTKLLVARFLEQSSCSMTPDIHELVENIKSVLKSDEGHMEEAITSASFLEQVPLRTAPGLLPVIGVTTHRRQRESPWSQSP